MNKKACVCLIFLYFHLRSESLKIYKSKVDFISKFIADFLNENVNSGLKYRNSMEPSIFTSNDFTACIRVYMKRLGTGMDMEFHSVANEIQ